MGDQVDTHRLLSGWTDGALKLHVVRTALGVRREHQELFLDGEYISLEVTGSRADHVVAFARRSGDDWAVVLAPRLTCRLAGVAGLSPEQPPVGEAVWGDTTVVLPDGAPVVWRDALTGDLHNNGVRLAHVLNRLPLALLTSA
jgi:(1->4)-alpha-D-glucan 1-alpha-D-glucosylmutase